MNLNRLIRLIRPYFSMATVAMVIAVILGFLFFKSFSQNQVVFSNDGPLGAVKSDSLNSSDALFKGYWADLNWLGSGGSLSAYVTYGLLWVLKPIPFAKFYAPITLLLLGLSAWIFFRTIGLKSALATVGAIAAALNSNFFSNTAWGLGTRSLTLAFVFFALAALSAQRMRHPWLNSTVAGFLPTVLAGLATGMAVVEGADNGVIFSLCVAAFVLMHSWVEGESVAQRLKKSFRLIGVAVFAGIIAVSALSSLFAFVAKPSGGAQVEEQSKEHKEQQWNFISQWSLPPKEMTRVLIPGLYGYRMDSPEGGNYWGRVGESPGVPGTRFSGAGEYAGVLVVLLAIWSLAASRRSRVEGGVFEDNERKMIWFWIGAFTISAVLSWGQFDPFAVYKSTVFKLPYFSSIRNPMKFMHVGHLALMILFGYGLLGLSRKYLEGTGGPASARTALKGSSFDRWWKVGMALSVVMSLLAFTIYSSARPALIRHLMNAGFPNEPLAKMIADFSIAEFGKFCLFLTLSVIAIWSIMLRKFGGKHAGWAAVMLGVVLTIDLARANTPWIIYWDETNKYASNPIIETLRQKPYEGRVVAPPFLVDPRALPPEKRIDQHFSSLYGIEWVQHHFQYYNIQSIDVAQDPRPPADKKAYSAVMFPKPGRHWELTNTRYLLGMAGFLDALNAQFDKGKNRFRIVTRFDIAPKPSIANPSDLEDLTAVTSPDGALALFEFTGALPRARLYPRWQVNTNDETVLKTLSDDAFDPHATVLVSDEIPASSAETTNTAPGSVEISNYSPRRIELRANAAQPTVLLLNDRYDRNWRVSVDGQVSKLLRCNFIMRGVQVPAGQHTVLFEISPPSTYFTALKISLTALAVGALLGLWWLNGFLRQADAERETTSPVPSGKAATPLKKK